MSSRRSASVGALPREKKHFVSRNESASGISLDVRCACQFFESDSLLPERINPVDSRPSSKQGFYDDLEGINDRLSAIVQQHEEYDQNLMDANVYGGHQTLPGRASPARSLNVNTHNTSHFTEFERLSMRSIGERQMSSEQSIPAVDLAFVEKYPELEETARARGLVVRNIGAAIPSSSGTFVAGMRGRQMSVSGISTTGMRDPDAISIRSGISVRRISRSPSKTDLFIADINIPKSQTRSGSLQREQRSVSVSRRSSNFDLRNFSSYAQSSATFSPPISVPIQAATPELQFQKTAIMSLDEKQRSPSPTQPTDYRKAKPPLSTDYMRPSENKLPTYYQPCGELMPQHRPIDLSKYESINDEPTVFPAMTQHNYQQAQAPSSNLNLLHDNYPPIGRSTLEESSKNNSHTVTSLPAKDDPLQQTVAALELIAATYNVEDVSDFIELKTEQPSVYSGDVHTPQLHLDEETEINIVNSLPTVDVDSFVQHEAQKAIEAHERRSRSTSRTQSPDRRRHRSPAPEKMDTLQLPSLSAAKEMQSAGMQSRLKRQRTPDYQQSPERTKKSLSSQQFVQFHTEPSPERTNKSPSNQFHMEALPKKHTLSQQSVQFQAEPITIISTLEKSKTLPLQAKASERKSSISYSTRFKSMFGNNNHKSNDSASSKKSMKRQKSLSPKREKSASPKPTRKFLSFKTKAQPTQIERVTSSNVKDPKNEPTAVKVMETFSLKVDEMDQYSSRAQKQIPPSLSASVADMQSHGREDIQSLERGSADISEAFTPIVISPRMHANLMSNSQSPYSSEIDVKLQHSESFLHSSRLSREPSNISQFGVTSARGQLYSAPIIIGSEENVVKAKNKRQRSVTPLKTRSPSQARPDISGSRLLRKSSFRDGRTQSTDRTRVTGSHENLFETRITKTVSFNFDERQSRLTEFENSTLTQKEKEKQDFLERTYFTREHEYEPIGVPNNEVDAGALNTLQQDLDAKLSAKIENLRDDMKNAENLQRDLEERYFSSEATTPRTESRTDYETHTSHVDSSALEELPLKPENQKKSFMASAQDRTRRMQAGFKNQAGKIKTKLRSTGATKKAPSGSPKAKERRRFKAPEFSKIKIPDIKRPDMSKLKEFKRPEFTKFNKPDMSKFKIPEKFSTLKLQRSKSLKENEPPVEDSVDASATTPDGVEHPQKKLFEFNFGTYPRAFRKKKKPIEPVESSLGTGTATEEPSVVPSTDTQASFQSSSSPQGDRGPGPVRSRWADKFSDVSYNDSEGSRYRRYGSEQESFDHESSLERRMKDDLEDTASEAPELGILSTTRENKQFAEFDEENRAIHEISNLRADEFKRRPIVHQDSDLRSEDSRDAVGWTEKEVQKIKLLRKAELEAEASYLKFPAEDIVAQDAQSTASSGKKVVMEEIDDDEFFLRKRGVSEDNIELRQYISNAIREGYDMPVNALEHVGQARQPIEYGDYDVPPPKPRRLNKSLRPEEASQEFISSQRSDYGDDLSMSQNGSDFFNAPRRPLRKGRSRSKYSMDSQEAPMQQTELETEERIRHELYFDDDDDDEEYLRPPKQRSNGYKNETHLEGMNNLDFTEKNALEELETQPQAPQRRKRHLRETSVEKEDSLINSLSGRSVSNNYLQPTEDVIVYRTEHEYYKPPLATPENYTDDTSTPSHKSRFEDEHTADNLATDTNLRYKYYDEEELQAESELVNKSNIQEKFVIDMAENDGYAVVRKEQVPKPTPPARRKKFTRSPGERFAILPSTVVKRATPPPPERPPPPRGYTPSTHSLELYQKDEDDYEEPGLLESERAESPRDLQSGAVINKMKFRPLPPPPRPPREKRQRNDSKRSAADYDEKELENIIDQLNVREEGNKRIPAFSSDESYGINDEESEDNVNFQEVEVSTQTDPLPDDFICEEFEITEDMRIIEPRIRRQSPKTLDDLLRDEQTAQTGTLHMTEDEQLARGLQRFRDANQRSFSERSRASSQAERSKSLSRPQTPSAIIIERRVSTPVPSRHESETMLEAALIVRPIDDLDLEEEALRREGLLTDESQHSKSDVEENAAAREIHEVEEEVSKFIHSDHSQAPSSFEFDETTETKSEQEEQAYQSDDMIKEYQAEIERKLRDYGYSEDKDTERYLNDYEKEEQSLPDVDKRLDQAIEDIIERHIRSEYNDDEQNTEQIEVPPPQPPPRRKSTVGVEQTAPLIVSQERSVSKELTPVDAIDRPKEQLLPSQISDLEVERLRVHALQAGQIMVSQLHGGQISAEELECKSGNLVVKSLELPPGFIEDIIDRVRSIERAPQLTTETQTSLQASRELLELEQTENSQNMMPPPKPPRQRDLESFERHRNHDEETQTGTGETGSHKSQPHHHHRHHHHHHHHRRCSSSSSDLNDDHIREFDSDGNYRSPSSLERRHHSRSRSRNYSPSECPSQSVSQAGKQFISACSLSLVNIIDQLTSCVRENDTTNKAQGRVNAEGSRLRQIPTLVVLFIVIVFGILIFLLTGRSVHTHHWDFFNPPGNEGRQS